jgi:hypothetical protein
LPPAAHAPIPVVWREPSTAGGAAPPDVENGRPTGGKTPVAPSKKWNTASSSPHDWPPRQRLRLAQPQLQPPNSLGTGLQPPTPNLDPVSGATLHFFQPRPPVTAVRHPGRFQKHHHCRVEFAQTANTTGLVSKALVVGVHLPSSCLVTQPSHATGHTRHNLKAGRGERGERVMKDLPHRELDNKNSKGWRSGHCIKCTCCMLLQPAMLAGKRIPASEH